MFYYLVPSLGLVLLINLHLLPASVSKNRFLFVSSAINSLVSSDGSVTYSLRNRTVLTPSDGFATLTWSLELDTLIHPPWGTKLLSRLVSKSRPSFNQAFTWEKWIHTSQYAYHTRTLYLRYLYNTIRPRRTLVCIRNNNIH